MIKFNLEGLGTPVNSAPYDNESAYKELLSRVHNSESLVVSIYTDKEGYSSFGIETKKVTRFKVRVNQAILNQVVSYLNNGKVDTDAVKPNELEPCDKEQDFKNELFKLLIDSGYRPQVAPLFRTAYGYVNAVFSFPKGRIYFHLERTDALLDYLKDKELL